jgi:putative spermidine/putrescine transport system permease protein
MGDTKYIRYYHRSWLYGVLALVLIFLIAPIFIVVPVSFSPTELMQFPPESFSFRWYDRLLTSTSWRNSAVNSLLTAVCTVCLTIPFATLAAYGLHASESRLAKLIWVVLMLPIIVPLILLAIGIYFLYAVVGLINTMPGLIAAHTMYTLPIATTLIASGFKRYDPNQEMVARSLGANRLLAFLKVTLPQIKRSLISAAFLTFIASFDEVVIALFVSGGPNSTLPRQMFNQLQISIDPTIAAISSILIVLALLVFTVMQLAGSDDD